MRELHADVVIIGGGVGGCAAAWGALRQGRRVLLTEECSWLGGQLTSQAVPPDEHPWIEQFGCTRSYRRLREQIREHYRQYYPLTEAARANRLLNPGNGFVSAICHEPRVSLTVLEGFLSPYRAAGLLTVLMEHTPVRAETDGDRLTSVHLEGPAGPVVVHAPYFVDATETGDLLPLAGVEYVTGAEAASETGESRAAAEAQPENQQAISWCFILDYRPGEDHTIDRPRDWDFWRDYVPPLTPAWGSKLLSFQATHPITLEPVVRTFDPVHPEPHRGPMDLWTFRRIADRANFQPGVYESDICLVNWPQIDYLPGNIVDVSPEERERHLEGSRQLSLSMLYWMQTRAPRRDGGTGWPGLRLRGDLCGTHHGLAMRPYIRESRRLRGRFTIKEQHVGVAEGRARAELFTDSVGIGAYRIDLHPSTGGDNYIDVSAFPFQIPLNALLPRRVTNLMAGGKNLACTHITNGCYRLHPVEWNVGEAAGLLAAFCLDRGRAPHQVGDAPEEFQALLRSEGVELEWPEITPL